MAAVFVNSVRASRVPVVVVLGATGTGKSKLALEIATRFKGEIISADSMQVYKGLDIITNKVTPEEQAQVPHHLLDFVDPLSRYSVIDFRDAALPIVERLLDQGTLPVIVGGTNYYIESLLWEVLIDPVSSERNSKLVFERDVERYAQQRGGNVKKLGWDVASRGVDSGGGERKRKSDEDSESDREAINCEGDKKKSDAKEIDSVETKCGSSNEQRCSKYSKSNDYKYSSANTDTEMKQLVANAVNETTLSTNVNTEVAEDKGGMSSNVKETEGGIGKSESGENGNERYQESGGDSGKSRSEREESGEDSGKSRSEREESSGAREGEKGDLVAWQNTDCPTKELYDRLWEVDPDTAATYHPNDRRKIISVQPDTVKHRTKQRDTDCSETAVASVHSYNMSI
ncbi:hypothetical protein Pcinc_035063 [Petrolisthes cinctipes]|uniref:Uncharacterized protein n=1 Tax=Petrolisthes cinctipes TaxID=88211 RepID=A0AAE1BX95_PETCI|nr:hypothetical protein Pcinc_035063 [Petrolisthes cinctipes]